MADRTRIDPYAPRNNYRGAPEYSERQDYRQQEQFRDDANWRERTYQPGYGQMGENPEAWHGQYEPGFSAEWDRNERYPVGQGGYGRPEAPPAGAADYQYGSARYGQRGRGFASFTSEDQQGRDFTAPTRRSGYGYQGGAAAARPRGYGAREGGYARDDERGWFDRAADEVAGWFSSDDDYEERRGHRGRGPRNYTRSDDRIREDACDNLTDDWGVDASDIEVSVTEGELTLDGTVSDRRAKRRAEDCVDRISGVRHVQNNLRVDAMTEGSSETARARGERTSGTLA